MTHIIEISNFPYWLFPSKRELVNQAIIHRRNGHSYNACAHLIHDRYYPKHAGKIGVAFDNRIKTLATKIRKADVT